MKRLSAKILIIANIIPLAGVLFFGWDLFIIMFLYWFENIIIGFLNVYKMLKAEGKDQKTNVKIGLRKGWHSDKYSITGFFMIHYGMFTFVHGVFVYVMFYSQIQSYLGMSLGVLTLFISHGLSYYFNYLGKDEYKKATPAKLMMQPYKRVIIMHMTILLGGGIAKMLGAPLSALIVMIALKIIIDLAAHYKEHAFFQSKKIS